MKHNEIAQACNMLHAHVDRCRCTNVM